MDKLHKSAEGYYVFYCPGCDCGHTIPVLGPHKWNWNGSLEAPTFTPSILVNIGSANPMMPICHSYITDGKITYLADCGHNLKNQTVEIPDWDTADSPAYTVH